MQIISVIFILYTLYQILAIIYIGILFLSIPIVFKTGRVSGLINLYLYTIKNNIWIKYNLPVRR